MPFRELTKADEAALLQQARDRAERLLGALRAYDADLTPADSAPTRDALDRAAAAAGADQFRAAADAVQRLSCDLAHALRRRVGSP